MTQAVRSSKIFFLTAVWLCLPLIAQPKPVFQTYTVDHGLPKMMTNRLLQDRTGFLWVATVNGLARFDGYHFRKFPADTETPGALLDSLVLTLAEDTDGMLWLGTRVGGLARFDPTREWFDHWLPENSDISDPAVNDLLIEDDTIWVGTNRGLNRFSRSTTRFTPIGGAAGRLRDIKVLERRDAQTLWLGTAGGLYLYRPEGNSLSQVTDLPDPAGHIRAIEPDGAGGFWIAAASLLLHISPDETVTYWSVGMPEGEEGENFLTSLQQDRQGYLWLGTNNLGIILLNPTTGRFQHFRHNEADRKTLLVDRIEFFYEDREGIMWVCTYGGGIAKWDRGSMPFTIYKNNPEGPNSLGNNSILSIAEDRKDRIWVGTVGGGLARFDRATDTFHHFRHDPTNPNSLSHNDVKSVFCDRDGILWLGVGNQMDRFDPETGVFTHLGSRIMDETNMGPNYPRVIIQGRDDLLWLGLDGTGLASFHPKTQRFEHYPHDPTNPGSLSHNQVLCLTMDAEGIIWVGTFGGGLNRFDPRTKTFTAYRNLAGDPNSLANDNVPAILIDSRNRYWISTHGGGLNRMYRDGGSVRFQAYTTKTHGLPNNIGGQIREDTSGKLWYTHANGITRFDPESETFNHFDSNDGTQNAYWSNSGLVTRSGEMYFGGPNGFTRFHPKDFKENTIPPNPVLTDFLILNKAVAPRHLDPNSPLEKVVSATPKIILPYTDPVFSFAFAGLHFSRPDLVRYRYKLTGFDNDWIETDSDKRFAVYTNLDAATYTFQVNAANKEGVWNPEPASIQLKILPPPWETWWAYSLYLLAVFGAILLYVRAQARKLAAQREQAEKERAINRRLRQLDHLKDEFLANTSHELRTPLNGIIGLAESLKDGATGQLPETTRNNLGMIVSSGKRLANLVNDILDFSKLKQRDLNLNLRAVHVHAIADVVLQMSKPLINDKVLTLANKVDLDLPLIKADESRLQQIMYNLVGNAVKFTESGSVSVSAEQEDDSIILCVTDTGIGIPKEKQETIFESFEQIDGSIQRNYGGTGLGLSITRQLVQLHGGDIWLDSTPGEGTRMYVRLPIAERDAPPPSGEFTKPDYSPELLGIAPGEPTSENTTPDQQPPVHDKPFTILIVDDEPVNRQVLRNYLSFGNYTLTEAGNGSEALALFNKAETFDLILLDIMMPGMSGYEVCRELRNLFPNHELPIIFLTAKDQPNDLVTGFSSGANDYLTKPITKDELLYRVKTHLELLDTNRNLEQKVNERTHDLSMRNQELETLDGIVKTINRETELTRLLETVLDQGLVLFPQAHMAGFLIFDAHRSCFRFAAGVGTNAPENAGASMTAEELATRYLHGAELVEHGIYLVHDLQKRPGNSSLESDPQPHSVLSITINRRSNLQGLLLLGNATQNLTFDEADGPKLARFREHVISAISKTELLANLRDKNEQILNSIRYAEHIQQAVLPETHLLKQALPESLIIFHPKDIVSGDFYWFTTKEDHLFLAVVDCTGHGVPGAIMSMIGNMLLKQVVDDLGLRDPAAILAELHIGVRTSLKQESRSVYAMDGMDMALCRIDPKESKVIFAGAHLPLFLVRNDSQGPAEELAGNRASIGGRQKEKQRLFDNRELTLAPGDTIYLASDGWADQPGVTRRKYGKRYLKQKLGQLNQATMSQIADTLETDLTQFRGPKAQRDDITLVGFRLPNHNTC